MASDPSVVDHEDRLRGLERVFEAALTRHETQDAEQQLIPTDTRQASLQQRYKNSPDYDDVDDHYVSQYSQCVAFLTTITASLATRRVGDVSDTQRDVIERVYRFTSGPVREYAHRMDPDSDSTLSHIDRKRLQSEFEDVTSAVRSADLISSEHTYTV